MVVPVLVDLVDTSSRLEQIGASKEDLIQVIQAAVGARGNATPLHPKFTKGMYAYIEGTYQLRYILASSGWVADVSHDNIESVYNEKTGVKIIYQNAISAGHPTADPIPLSKKGAASARAVAAAQDDFFPELLLDTLSETCGEIWYLFVEANGLDVRAELSRPYSIENNQFQGFVERIILVQEGEWDTPDLSDNEQYPEIEVNVSRKIS